MRTKEHPIGVLRRGSVGSMAQAKQDHSHSRPQQSNLIGRMPYHKLRPLYELQMLLKEFLRQRHNLSVRWMVDSLGSYDFFSEF